MGARLKSIAYGAGNLGVALFFNTTQTWLIFFYVDIVRLDARLVGLAFALAYGVWNAINDPLIGALSDRTRTRWGRRVPYIALGTPFVLLLFFLVWSPPLGGHPLADPRSWGLLAWFAVVIALFDLANTAVSVPYVSLFPELYPQLRERTEVSIYRQVFAMIGTALGLAIMPLLVGGIGARAGTLAGWRGAGLVLGAVGAASLGVSLMGSREPARAEPRQAMPLLQAFRTTLVNRSFLTYMVADLMINFIWSWLSVMVPFFCKYVIGASNAQTSILFAAMIATALALYPAWRAVALRIGSRATLAISVSLFVIFLLPVLVVRTLPQAIVMMLLVGSAHSGITLVREILLGDVIDEDELATGRRREGSYFGVCAFIERLVLVLIGGATALVLSLSRYDAAAAAQPGTVSLGIRLGMTILPLVAVAILLVALRLYPLGRQQVQDLKLKLD
ncbi:MAG: MFS transporter, partial [Spirochaetes bacterium]|nr:MFS transporter [Spirochaetota bacterium]